MREGTFYAIALELVAHREVRVPFTMGHLAHALFLNLIKRFDQELSARLHGEPMYRPYTISPLLGGETGNGCTLLRRNQPCYLRITLLDNGHLWRALQRYFLEAGPITVSLGKNDFQLSRMLFTPHTGPTGWVDSTDLQTLITFPVQKEILLTFCSPTAFSLGNHQFQLFPEPVFVWESLLRTWNRSTPEYLNMEKQQLCDCIKRFISMTSCAVETAFMHFPRHVQKGFVGQCTYQIAGDHPLLANLTTLAAFAYYAGVGYKTTMGMGQVQVLFGDSSPT